MRVFRGRMYLARAKGAGLLRGLTLWIPREIVFEIRRRVGYPKENDDLSAWFALESATPFLH
jgi:hypothetical protein